MISGPHAEDAEDKDVASILIIDDEEGVINAVYNILSLYFTEVMTATSAEQGIALALKKRPDVILLDYYLGETNGKEVFETFHSHPETEDIPIVFISAHSSAEKDVASIGEHISFVKKPFSIQELNRAIARQLQ